MPSFDDMFPSKFLKASDAGEEDLTLTISRIDGETVGQGNEAKDKFVVYFEECDKGLVLNKTNANAICGLYGTDSDDWVGKQVTLFSTEVDFQGKMVLALRVRLKAPKKKLAAAKAPPVVRPVAPAAAEEEGDGDEEIPF